MKKILAVLTLLALVCAASAYVVLAPGLKEERRAAVAALLKDLPGECTARNIEVEILPGNVILDQVRWRLSADDGRGFDLRAGEVVFKGVNSAALQSSGRADLAREVDFSGLELAFFSQFHAGDEPVEDMRMAGLRLGGLKGDAALLLRCLHEETSPGQNLDALMGLSLESAAVTGYDNRTRLPGGKELLFGVTAASVRDMRALSMGRGVWEGISLSLEGTGSLALQRLTLDELSLPDILRPLVAPSADAPAGNASPEDVPPENISPKDISADTPPPPAWSEALAVLEKDALVLGNLELTGLLFERADGEKISARKLFLDLRGNAQEASIKQRAEELVLSPGFFTDASDGPARFVRAWGQNLALNSRLDLSVRQAGLRGEAHLREAFLEDRSLGSLTAKGDLLFDGEGEAEPLDTGLALSLKHGELLLTDRQALAVFLRSSLPDPENTDARRLELLRRHMAEAFELDVIQAQSPGEAALFRGMAQLVRAPGSLRLVFNPEEPVPLARRDGLAGELNVASEYSPAGAAE